MTPTDSFERLLGQRPEARGWRVRRTLSRGGSGHGRPTAGAVPRARASQAVTHRELTGLCPWRPPDPPQKSSLLPSLPCASCPTRMPTGGGRRRGRGRKGRNRPGFYRWAWLQQEVGCATINSNCCQKRSSRASGQCANLLARTPR